MLSLFLTRLSIKSNLTFTIDLITIFKVKFDSMSVNKKVPLVNEDDKEPFIDEQIVKRNHEHVLNEKNEITEGDVRHVITDIIAKKNETPPDPGRFDVADKLIGDDLEIRKVNDGSTPEIDTELKSRKLK